MPILASYYSGIPGFTLSDVFLIIFFLLSLLKKDKKNFNFNNLSLGALCLIYILFTLITLLSQKNNSQIMDILIRTIRFSFYTIIIIFTSYKLFNIKYAFKYIKNISILGTCYIIIQYISYYVFHKVLKGFVSFLPLYTSSYQNFNYEYFYKSLYFRPTSFFLEPAHFSRYALIAVILILFLNKENGKIKHAIFITAGIISSTSGQGIFLVFIVWIIWIVNYIIKTNSYKKLIKSTLLFTSFPIILFLLNNISVINYAISRLQSISETSAIYARLYGFINVINNLDGYTFFIGKGFGSYIGFWLSSGSYILYGTGFIGFLLTLYFFVRLFFKSNKTAKILTLCYLFLFITDDSYFTYINVLYFSFIFYCNYNFDEEYEKNIIFNH